MMPIQAFLTKLLPRGIIKHIRVTRDLGPRDGAAYVKLQVLRALGVRRDHVRGIPAGVRSVLFVCHGNIIRSPMAAAMLRQCLSEADRHAISIASAGLHANRTRGADTRALIVAREFGISLDEHRPQSLTHELVERTDAIFVFDYLNEAKLLTRYPEARRKVFMLGVSAEGGRLHQIEITDPFDGDATDIRHCYEILQRCIRSLVRILFPPDQDKR
jgi:protein-tyrosine phosphatase